MSSKIEAIKAAVDRLKTTECHGTVVNTEALRELRALLADPNKCGQCGATTTDICNQNGCGFLESGNGAPVVERQPLPIYQVRYLGDGGAGWSDVEKDELDQLKPRKDYHTRTVFDAPPELAELQATIAKLTAENERLNGLRPDFPPRPPDGEGLPRYGLRWNGPQQPLAVQMDDGYWTPWHLADQLKAEIDRLKGGQGEPVATGAAKSFAKGFNTLQTGGGKYKIVMEFSDRDDAWDAYNALAKLRACLDKVKELNQ